MQELLVQCGCSLLVSLVENVIQYFYFKSNIGKSGSEIRIYFCSCIKTKKSPPPGQYLNEAVGSGILLLTHSFARPLGNAGYVLGAAVVGVELILGSSWAAFVCCGVCSCCPDRGTGLSASLAACGRRPGP